eukprot:7153988-Pyramimonas_sp.AAC.1
MLALRLRANAGGPIGKARRARNKALRIQFGSIGAHLVGIQEARNPKGTRCADDFIVFSSGHAQESGQGGLGVELWVNRRKPYATVGKKELVLAPSHVQ